MYKGPCPCNMISGSFAVILFLGLFLVLGEISFIPATTANASQEAPLKLSPVKALTVHESYYPGAEDLGPDEMRITACGTGMPNARPKQAAACWLVELGNGDKFIFDIGSGSFEGNVFLHWLYHLITWIKCLSVISIRITSGILGICGLAESSVTDSVHYGCGDPVGQNQNTAPSMPSKKCKKC